MDLRQLSYIDAHGRINLIDGEFYLYYGMLKKSLLESLPWLGLAAFAVVGIFNSERRAAHALCLLFPLVWFLPTAATEWSLVGRGTVAPASAAAVSLSDAGPSVGPHVGPSTKIWLAAG